MKWWKWDLKLFIIRIIQEEKDFEEFLRFLIYFLENLKFGKSDGMIEINFETVWELFYKKKKISIIFIKKLLKFLKFLIKFF